MSVNVKIFIFISIAISILILPLRCLLCAEFEEVSNLLYFPNPDARISMDFKEASLRDVLKIFSIQSGLNFLATDAVKDRKLTIYLDNVPVKDAMDKIFRANNLTYDLGLDSNVFIVKELGKPEIETITRIYHLRYARLASSKLSKQIGDSDVSGIVDAIKNVLTEHGSIAEDSRTNKLMITDVPSRFALIEQLISSLDVPTPQVMIEVEMIDTTKGVLDELGVDWSKQWFNLTGATISESYGTKFPYGTFFPGTGADKITVGTMGSGNLSAALDLLTTRTDTRFLARPRLLTLSNETAEIKITTDEAIGKEITSSTSEGVTTVTESAERAETGISLKVTPQVNLSTREITLFVEPVVKEAKASNISLTVAAGVTQQVRDPEERSTKSVVKIKDGQTLIIGGLIRHTESTILKRVPLLSDIPFLGALFRHKTNEPKERELIIFITPHIVMDESTKEFTQMTQEGYSTPIYHEQGDSYMKRQDMIEGALNQFNE